jgi:hypothetical protein
LMTMRRRVFALIAWAVSRLGRVLRRAPANGQTISCLGDEPNFPAIEAATQRLADKISERKRND